MVTKDVPANAVVGGVPAKVIRMREAPGSFAGPIRSIPSAPKRRFPEANNPKPRRKHEHAGEQEGARLPPLIPATTSAMPSAIRGSPKEIGTLTPVAPAEAGSASAGAPSRRIDLPALGRQPGHRSAAVDAAAVS